LTENNVQQDAEGEAYVHCVLMVKTLRKGKFSIECYVSICC